MQQVIEINDIRQLDAYRLAWKALLGRTRGATFFQSLQWLEVYWRHFGQGQKLRVLVVIEAGKPTGIVPLVVRTEQRKVGPVRVLTYPLHDWASFYGPIGSDATITLRAAMRHLRRSARDWDLLEMRWVNNERVDHRRTELAMQAAGFAVQKSAMTQSGIVDLSGGWEEYWGGLPSHWRTNVHRSAERLAARGAVKYVRYRPQGSAYGDDDPRGDLYEACERVAEQSWQGDWPAGTTRSHDSIRGFLRDAHGVAVKAGAVDLNLLLVDGRPVAFAYNFHFQGSVSCLRTGYDRQVAKDGAGSVLLQRLLQESVALGDRTVDLGRDCFDGKRHWLSRTQTPYRYTHYPRTVVRAQALWAGQWLKRRLSSRRAAASNAAVV